MRSLSNIIYHKMKLFLMFKSSPITESEACYRNSGLLYQAIPEIPRNHQSLNVKLQLNKFPWKHCGEYFWKESSQSHEFLKAELRSKFSHADCFSRCNYSFRNYTFERKTSANRTRALWMTHSFCMIWIHAQSLCSAFCITTLKMNNEDVRNEEGKREQISWQK